MAMCMIADFSFPMAVLYAGVLICMHMISATQYFGLTNNNFVCFQIIAFLNTEYIPAHHCKNKNNEN